MRKQLLDFVAKKGTLLHPDAADYLLKQPDPMRHLTSIIENLEQPPLILTLRDVMIAENIAIKAATRLVDHDSEKHVLEPKPEIFKTIPSSSPTKIISRQAEPAKNYEEDLLILKDITGHSTCEGKIEDFSKYFLNRFHIISSMLRQRRELSGSIEIARAKRTSRDVSLIGMVSEVKITRNGHRLIWLEDETDRITVLSPTSTPMADTLIVTDEVVGITGKVNSKGMLIAGSIVKPDIPTNHRRPLSADNVSIAFVSDIHVGSKSFLDSRWEKFTRWITNGDECAQSIKYVLMTGDLVDGIGVYPRQDEDLAIDDIYEQYEMLAKLIEQLPSHLRIILVPGNHDAVRPAEPQPAFPEAIRKLFPTNVLSVGNPCMLRVHGVRILAYHGRSMDDLVSSVPTLSYAKPLEAMKDMLRMRHLAPIYGGRTPIAPEAHDLLTIEEVPDIFVTGHVHGAGVGEYRGVTLINSSAWQSQTSYQKMRNLEPLPGRVPIVNLSTGKAIIKEF